MTATTSLADITTGKKPASALATLSANLEKLKPQMAMALPKHLNADRMTRLALTAFSTTPGLQKCSMQSIAASLMTASQLGLEPGVNGQGYLIPYKDTATFVPGWKGLVDLVARAGRATVWTGAVFDGDDFDYQLGDAPFVKHRPNEQGNEGAFKFVYAIGRVRDAQMPIIEVWSRAKVERHLKTYNKVGDRHYAKASENNFQMYGRKVALLQILKYMPQSVELSQATELSHATDVGASAVIDVQGMVITTPPDIDPDTGEIKPPKADDGVPKLSYAEVMNVMQNAKTLDALDDAALGIEAVADEGQRRELQVKYEALRAALIAPDHD